MLLVVDSESVDISVCMASFSKWRSAWLFLGVRGQLSWVVVVGRRRCLFVAGVDSGGLVRWCYRVAFQGGLMSFEEVKSDLCLRKL